MRDCTEEFVSSNPIRISQALCQPPAEDSTSGEVRLSNVAMWSRRPRSKRISMGFTRIQEETCLPSSRIAELTETKVRSTASDWCTLSRRKLYNSACSSYLIGLESRLPAEPKAVMRGSNPYNVLVKTRAIRQLNRARKLDVEQTTRCR
jgi:hypothetical protein